MRVLTAESMREVDRVAIEELGIPGIVLMENAAVGVAEAIGKRYPEARRIAIFCGPGNNGGDGFALARLLISRGYSPALFVLACGREYTGDAAVQREICRRMGLGGFPIDSDRDLDAAQAALQDVDLVVDALFGTGLKRPLEGLAAECVERLNTLDGSKLAVDVPSGLAGSSDQIPGPHLVADLTVTFAAPKVAHVLPPAASAVGEVIVAGLGIPRSLIDGAEGDLRFLEQADARLLVPQRAAEAHKGSLGHVLVVGGSPGKSGAALLATRGALRGGAGLVTVAVPETLMPVLEASSLESMTLALPADADAQCQRVLEAAEERSVVALGPGLGTDQATVEMVRRVVAEISRPVVLDADGLNAFAGRIEELAAREGPLVLTPHPAELARLLGLDTAAVVGDRLGAVRRAVEQTGKVVLLKGHRSLIGDPDGIAINPTGNPGMATGGTGDVMTGLIAALIGQGRSAVEAAELGAYIHGLAGDLASDAQGEIALTAGDLAEQIAPALAVLGAP